MFDLGWSKLIIIAMLAIVVVGPKDLPALLRTIGKYMGIIKRHAADFRAQFDEAMRESELDQLKKEVEKVGTEAEATMHAAEQSVDKQLGDARQDVDALMGAEAKPAVDPLAHDTGALPTAEAVTPAEAQPALNGASHPAQGTAEAPTKPAAAEPGSPGVKAGA